MFYYFWYTRQGKRGCIEINSSGTSRSNSYQNKTIILTWKFEEYFVILVRPTMRFAISGINARGKRGYIEINSSVHKYDEQLSI